jgi:hypothetical protein
MERRQKAAKVKKTKKRRRDGQKGGKCRLNTAKSPPWVSSNSSTHQNVDLFGAMVGNGPFLFGAIAFASKPPVVRVFSKHLKMI